MRSCAWSCRLSLSVLLLFLIVLLPGEVDLREVDLEELVWRC